MKILKGYIKQYKIYIFKNSNYTYHNLYYNFKVATTIPDFLFISVWLVQIEQIDGLYMQSLVLIPSPILISASSLMHICDICHDEVN